MESLYNQVQNGKIWPLTGGVHPPNNKAKASEQPIASLPIPQQLIIPVKQHIGVAGKLLVNVGENVLKGQALTEPVKAMSLPIHAPTSGIISKIAEHPIAHPSGLSEPCIFIDTDGQDTWVERKPLPHYTGETPEYLVDKLKQAGISGLGGAGFPAYVKSASLRKINYLIINATECEPYICADDALIRRNAESIIQGIDIVANIVHPEMIIIGIEDDKPEAIKALKRAAEHRHDIHIRVFPSKYPSGGEKQLIHILTGQHVPTGGLPIDIGILVHNIGTLFAIYNAVICDEPLVSRIVTVTGGAVKSPQNVEVLIGTPVKELLNFCDFEAVKDQRIIMGGPMMGFTLAHTDIPIVKISNCILAPGKNELSAPEDEMDCIRCSACADVCPISLLPQQLYWYSKAKEHAKAQEYNLKDCIECGACAYVCPSEIPLVQYYRVAKAEIKAHDLEKQQAEKAKLRFEQRKERLERDAQERTEKQRLAAEKRKQALNKSGGGDAVAAALARVKAKKAATSSSNTATTAPAAPSTVDKALSPAQQAVAKAKARKAEKDAQAAAANDQQPASEQKPQQQLTPAQKAVAKAKARKAEKEAQATAENGQQPEPDQKPEQEPEKQPEPEQQLTPAQKAVAKAKARKAEKDAQAAAENAQQPESEQKPEQKPEQQLTPAQKAVAKAKARKAEKDAQLLQQQSQQNDNEPNE